MVWLLEGADMLVAEVLAFDLNDDRDAFKHRANCRKLKEHVLAYIKWEIDHNKLEVKE